MMKITFFYEKYLPHIPLIKILLMELRNPLERFCVRQVMMRSVSLRKSGKLPNHRKYPDWLFKSVAWLEFKVRNLIKLIPEPDRSYDPQKQYRIMMPEGSKTSFPMLKRKLPEIKASDIIES
jgi:hypothetical protein